MSTLLSGASSKEASGSDYLQTARNVTGVIYSIGKFVFYGVGLVGSDVIHAVGPRAVNLAADLTSRMIGPKPEPTQIQEYENFQDRLRPIGLEELLTNKSEE